jgi:diacylglycerol kinase (ATP)
MTHPMHPMKGRTGLQRILNATGYSIAGLRAAYLGESAFRQEVWMCAVLVPAAFWVGQDWVQTALLAASAGLVLVVELLNSGIEAVVDRISYDHHDLSKRAKDIASAAVFLSLVICGSIWAAALWHRWIAV